MTTPRTVTAIALGIVTVCGLAYSASASATQTDGNREPRGGAELTSFRGPR
jgi:hypothetical protein